MLRIAIIVLIAVPVAYLAVAIGLAMSQSPEFVPGEGAEGIDFAAAMTADYSSLPEARSFTARDGTALSYRRYGAQDEGPLVILIHGSAWHGMQFHPMAGWLAERIGGTVVVPDMRGHGRTPVRRGDIDYVGQLEQDMLDLIDALDPERARRVVVGGHSSGGGFALRFAGGPHGERADAFILMAPFLKYDAPTTRPNSGGWARPAVRRIIGLTMLNAVGITALDHLPVISFAMPRQVMDGPYGETATVVYSYRLNAGFAPRPDYAADLEAIEQPVLVVAGTEDEAFFAERYEPTMAPHLENGTFRLLPGLGHMGLTSDPATVEAIATWLEATGRADEG